MRAHQQGADHQDPATGQIDKRRQYHHAHACDPDDLEVKKGVMGIERPEKGNDKEFCEGQPQAAGKEEKGELFLTPFCPIEACRDTCQENKDGCAVMRDPAGEEEEAAGLCQIERIVLKGISVKIAANMIEGHNDHDRPSEKVDRRKPTVSHC